EVEAMRFVAELTSIPVPTVFDAWKDGRFGWIVMDFIPGENMDVAWPGMSASQREHVSLQLDMFLRELHTLPPPRPGWIGSCSYGPCYNHR
ncbi:hypothetical protein K439DRAFT_1246287, partial [Ramaria rubella]